MKTSPREFQDVFSTHIHQLEQITGQSVTLFRIPFSSANLKRVGACFDYYCSFLHNIVFFFHNNFEIIYLVEGSQDSAYRSSDSLDSQSDPSLLFQFSIIRRIAIEHGLDFIDFSRFHVDGDGRLRFPVTIERQDVSTPCEWCRDLDLDASEPTEPVEYFAYRFSSFACGIFEKYPLNLADSHPNLRIRVKTSTPVQNKIIKIHLYHHYCSKVALLFFPTGNFSQLSEDLCQLCDGEKHLESDDFAGFAFQFLKYKHNLSRSGVLFIVETIDKKTEDFFNYLLDVSGGRGISFLRLGGVGGGVNDIELQEKASNLADAYSTTHSLGGLDLAVEQRMVLRRFACLDFPIPERDIKRMFPDTPDSILDILIQSKLLCKQRDCLLLNPHNPMNDFDIEPREKLTILKRLTNDVDSLALRLNYLAESSQWQEIKKLLKDNLKEGDECFANPGHVLLHYRLMLYGDEELLVLAAENMFKVGDDEKIERLLEEAEGAAKVILTIKMAHILKYRREHQQMYKLLSAVKGRVPEQLADEYHYLNFIYFQKISNSQRAAAFQEKIKSVFFLTLADVHQSTRLIYRGKFEEAGAALKRAIAYLKKKKYHRETLYAQSQLATLLRDTGDYSGAEHIYQNICIQADSLGLQLSAAYFSIDLGNLYVYRDEFPYAEYWYKKSLRVFQQLGNKNGIDLARSNLMDVYKWKGLWLKAEKYYRYVLRIDREKKLVHALGVDYYNIAHLNCLKHDFTRALSGVEEALTLFRQCESQYCIIEGELLKARILTVLGRSYPWETLDGLQKGFNHDQNLVSDALKRLQYLDPKSGAGDCLGLIGQCKAATHRFELLVLYISLTGDRGALGLLKEDSSLLGGSARNYFFYEYYYLYFETLENLEEIDGGLSEIFNEVYLFFSKNVRRLSQQILKIKKFLDNKDSFEDVFQSADLVGRSQGWTVADDFFRSFLSELKKATRVTLVKLVVYEHGMPVFRFADGDDYERLSDELVDLAIQRAEHLKLAREDILKLSNSPERAFYKHPLTRVQLWKISDQLFGVLVLGFSREPDRHNQTVDSLEALLKKFAPLLGRFYDVDFKCNEKLSFIVGHSKQVRILKRQILKISTVDFSVLITGESGSGKELVAKGIHLLSQRAANPFIAVNAAAIPENLLEAELFGYMKGAFSGAADNRVGLIESADSGTLFLDEIGELPLNLQAKLLRVLQEREIRRLGANQIKKVDVRLVCATNRDLLEMCRQRLFREDLYYRIQDLSITVPPLRERLEDLPILFHYFLKKYNFSLADEAEFHSIASYWQGHDWPGNIRELESKVRRLITFYPDAGMDNLPSRQVEFSLKHEREMFERGLLIRILSENDWNKVKTAEQLKISRMSLFNLIKKYNIRRIEGD